MYTVIVHIGWTQFNMSNRETALQIEPTLEEEVHNDEVSRRLENVITKNYLTIYMVIMKTDLMVKEDVIPKTDLTIEQTSSRWTTITMVYNPFDVGEDVLWVTRLGSV